MFMDKPLLSLTRKVSCCSVTCAKCSLFWKISLVKNWLSEILLCVVVEVAVFFPQVRMPDVEFFINLGDWPLEKRTVEENPVPIFSWCGSDVTLDIILPTYDVTDSTLEAMRGYIELCRALQFSWIIWFLGCHTDERLLSPLWHQKTETWHSVFAALVDLLFPICHQTNDWRCAPLCLHQCVAHELCHPLVSNRMFCMIPTFQEVLWLDEDAEFHTRKVGGQDRSGVFPW